MTIKLYRLWLAGLLLLSSLLAGQAQTITLSNGDPNADPLDAFDGNVFQAGNQFGDAAIYATLSGGAKSFQIVSPGESLTRTVSTTGYFSIRPTGNMTIDKTKILNFSGTVNGSVVITVKPLTITTQSANVTTEVAPGSEINVSYTTGSGTFPVDLALGKFKVQLLDASGNLIGDLLNSTDQYAGREQAGSSRGGTRYIKATIPATTASGTYRVRVVTQGLNTNVMGSPSPTFVVKTNTLTINTGSVGSTAYCAGLMVSFPFSTTGSFGTGNSFKVQLSDASGSNFQDLTETGSASPIRATLPTTLAAGSYKYRVVSTSPGVIGSTGTINVSALPTLTVSGTANVIAGSPASVQLALTGTPPWSFDYIDNSPDIYPNTTRSTTTSSSQLVISPTLFVSSSYGKESIKNFKDSGCGASGEIRGSAQIAVSPLTITTANLPAAYCPGSTISVSFSTNGKLPGDATYQVELSDDKGSFQSPQIINTGGRTSPINASVPKDLAPGAGYKLRVVLQKSGNQGGTDYSSIVNSVPGSLALTRPEAPQTTDVYFCPGSSPGQLSAVGSNLQWYSDGVALPGAPVPPSNRSSKYTVNQTVDNCVSKLAIINVVQKQAPAAPAVTNVALCQGGQGQFSSTIPGALWYTAAAGGTGTAQPPNVNNQSVGDQTVYVSQTVEGCEGPRAPVKVTVYATPSAPTVQTPSPVCQFGVASPLTALGQNLTWYDQSGKLGSAPTPETSSSGTRSYSVTQSINGCESPRALITQEIRSAPANPTVQPVSYCIGDTPKSLTATGTNLRWYTAQAGGTNTASPIIPSTNTASVLTYYVSQTDNNGCESLRQPVTVSILSAPSAPVVTATQTVCQGAKLSPLVASPNTGLLWTGPGISGSQEAAPTPATVEAGTLVYTVIQRAGSCQSQPATITVSVRKQPVAPQVASPALFCIGQTSKPLTATASGQLSWYTSVNLNGLSAPQVTPNTAQAGSTTYYVTQTDEYKCESAATPLDVRVSTQATARLTGDDEINVGDSTAIRVRLTGEGPWQFTDWNGKLVRTTDSLYVSWEKPKDAKVYTYAIQELAGSCGLGEIKNSYNLMVRAPLGITPLAEPSRLSVYPNPTTGDVSAEWSVPSRQTIDLQLINADGKVIRQVTRQAVGQSQTESIRLGGQPAGKYYLRLVTPKNGVVTRPIVKE